MTSWLFFVSLGNLQQNTISTGLFRGNELKSVLLDFMLQDYCHEILINYSFCISM